MTDTPKTLKRIDHLLVSVIVTEYDESGRPLGEAQSDPIKLFRAQTPDVWAVLDERLKASAPR